MAHISESSMAHNLGVFHGSNSQGIFHESQGAFSSIHILSSRIPVLVELFVAHCFQGDLSRRFRIFRCSSMTYLWLSRPTSCWASRSSTSRWFRFPRFHVLRCLLPPHLVPVLKASQSLARLYHSWRSHLRICAPQALLSYLSILSCTIMNFHVHRLGDKFQVPSHSPFPVPVFFYRVVISQAQGSLVLRGFPRLKEFPCGPHYHILVTTSDSSQS